VIERDAVVEYADALLSATASGVPIGPFSEGDAPFEVRDAYAVQRATLERRLAAGDRLIGRKIGLTNTVVQRQLGIDQPDFGFLTATMHVANAGALRRADFIAPRVEPEIAFVLRSGLRGPGIGAADVRRATGGVCAALEIIDSRIADWRIGFVDTVADNASSSRVVTSPRLVPLHDCDLVRERVVLYANEAAVGDGTGAAVLGDPAEAVAWLVNALAEYGDELHAGDLVLPGAMCAAAWVAPASTYRAAFATLGDVSVTFG
jgi:2-keto-4-pentenoate hydratase